MASSAAAVSRTLIGEPLRSDRLDETLLPKRLALPVFCSDPLSSVAYATEQIVLVLGLGGLALLHLTPWLAAAVVALLVIVVASYRQTCAAYPNGGGAYAVSRANLGEDAALVAASSLLIDYVLTVAVSVVAGVAAITSAIPALADHAVALSLGFVAVLTIANLRGVKESGRAFAVPTYGFVAVIYAMLAVAFAKIAFGDGITAESAHYELRATAETGGLLTVFLVLRAFASGLHGADGGGGGLQRRAVVPAAEEPQRGGDARRHGRCSPRRCSRGSRRSRCSRTSTWPRTRRRSSASPRAPRSAPRSARSAWRRSGETAPFFLLQGFTAAILVLAANTAFNGFPVLASLLGRDGHLPRQLAHRGDRLVFSNGIVLLAGVAGAADRRLRRRRSPA